MESIWNCLYSTLVVDGNGRVTRKGSGVLGYTGLRDPSRETPSQVLLGVNGDCTTTSTDEGTYVSCPDTSLFLVVSLEGSRKGDSVTVTSGPSGLVLVLGVGERTSESKTWYGTVDRTNGP